MRLEPDMTPIGFMTYNIRYAATKLFPGEAPWSKRLPLLISHFHYHTRVIDISFLCLQEVLRKQLIDLNAQLNMILPAPRTATLDRLADEEREPTWNYIGVGRDDGMQAGEYAPIFYRSETWKLLYKNTLWLSETPTVPGSKGWDAASIRICTVGLFRHNDCGIEVVVLNTHLDDQGVVAREEAALMLKQQVALWNRKGMIVVLAGDLNSSPTEKAYEILTAANSPLSDTRECVPAESRYGEEMTFTGFEGRDEDKERLDYLFVGPKANPPEDEPQDQDLQGRQSWTVTTYAVLPNKFDAGIYHSDHRAVVAVMNIP